MEGLKVFGESVRGASHVRAGKECQDCCRAYSAREYAILAVADGHGSSSCPYSADGARLAVTAFCDLMESYYSKFCMYEEKTDLFTFLNREGSLTIPKKTEAMWKELVWAYHRRQERPIVNDAGETMQPSEVCRLYGTTLLGLLITKSYVYAFQLGDGDIMYVDGETIRPVIEGDHLLGVETYSLSGTNSWQKALSAVEKRDVSTKGPCVYILSTDGMANSYSSGEEFYRTCRDYFSLLREYGPDAVAEQLPDWLNETSEKGCGDDISAAFAYFSDV